MPFNHLKSPVTSSRLEINTSGLPIPLKLTGKQCTSMLVILWLVILKTSRISTEPNLGPQSRRRRLSRSLNPRPRLQLPTVILILLISVCGVVWFQRQGPFFQDSSHNQLGPDLVPFVDIQSQQINAVPSALEPVLTVANQITSASLVPAPRVQPSSNQTLPLRNEPGPVRDSLVIKDEYFCVGNDFDCDQFTEDYFEYKQGQKDIIHVVKNRLRNHMDFWRKKVQIS